jgi:hypothetical protein
MTPDDARRLQDGLAAWARIELELGVADVDWARLDPVDAGTRRVVNDGVVPLVDKDGLLGALSDACCGS